MESRSLTYRLLGSLVATALLFSLAPAASFNADQLLKTLTHRWGAHSAKKFRQWQQMEAEAQKLPSQLQQLKEVNNFWNRHIQFVDDIEAWDEVDYWATPMESLGHGEGDCEDFAIAKYFSLLSAGIDISQLRLIYVKAQIGGADSGIVQAHMVLAYYSSPDAEPLVLDNLLGDILPASRRRDLTPVFSFNGQGIWAGVAANTGKKATSTSRLSRWQDLLARAKAEGFE